MGARYDGSTGGSRPKNAGTPECVERVDRRTRSLKLAIALLISLGLPASAAADPDRVPQRDDKIQFGWALGGPSYAEVLMRARLLPGLYAEAGLNPFFEPIMMGSAGLVGAVPVSSRVSLYAGASLGGVAMFAIDACPPDAVDCVDTDAGYFGSARVGVSIGFGRRTRIGLDVGAWRGESGAWGNHGLAGTRRFTIPMIGVSWLVGDPHPSQARSHRQ